ncbi:MAG: ferrous iron transport protein A [Planctomycetes bacterium]|nr:ferrous iron transport protein A [Planctomycetota bacterium]
MSLLDSGSFVSTAEHAPADRAPRLICGLHELGRRQSAKIVDVDPAVSPRLAALGFCKGTILRLDRRAPLGDPRIFELRGTRLALRKSDARLIRVELI